MPGFPAIIFVSMILQQYNPKTLVMTIQRPADEYANIKFMEQMVVTPWAKQQKFNFNLNGKLAVPANIYIVKRSVLLEFRRLLVRVDLRRLIITKKLICGKTHYPYYIKRGTITCSR